ncbi:hypothetical protein V8F06_001929 [Rhypophila decipiens]
MPPRKRTGSRGSRGSKGSDVTMKDAEGTSGAPKIHPMFQVPPIPVEPLAARDPADLGSNRDDPTGHRYDAYWKSLSRTCQACWSVDYKRYIYAKFEKAFEPPALGEKTNQGVLSANRKPRPEIPFRNLANAIQRFCQQVLPDPEMEKKQEQELRGIFEPRTPPGGVRRRRAFQPKFLKPYDTLPDEVKYRLDRWAHDETFLKSIWTSEHTEHRWAIFEAWIWHYLQDCHFLTSRIEDHDDEEDDDPNQPANLNNDPALPLPTNRPSNLDGLDPPLRTQSLAHKAWNILLEEFAPWRNYPGIYPLTLNANLDKTHTSNERHAIAYDVWRKATLALLPRTTMTSEFPYQIRDVIAHLARHLTHILGDDVFPRKTILDFASETMKSYYRTPKKNINPYDNPSDDEVEIVRQRNMVNALIDIVDNAIDFRNQKDRDVRSWEVVFRPPSTAATWQHDLTAPPHSFPLDESIMDIIIDSRSAASIYANVPSPTKRKGKEKATSPSPITRWEVAWVATPMLYENRYVRAGYYVFDQYMCNNLQVILKGTATTKARFDAIQKEQDQWNKSRDKPPEISPVSTAYSHDSEDSLQSSEGEDAVKRREAREAKRAAKIAAKEAAKRLRPRTPERGTNKIPTGQVVEPGRSPGETKAGSSKKPRLKSPERPPDSPSEVVRKRKEERAARLQKERLQEEAALVRERRDRGRSTWERVNQRREERGLAPLPPPEDFADFEDPDEQNRPRIFGVWR